MSANGPHGGGALLAPLVLVLRAGAADSAGPATASPPAQEEGRVSVMFLPTAP